MANRSTPESQWSPVAAPPQRYSTNYPIYRQRGGVVDPVEDARGFAGGGAGDGGRFFFFCLMLDQLQKEGLSGDIAELGVYKGHTASLLALMARRLGKTVYLFDTFGGFHAADFSGVDAGKAVEFLDTSLAAVRELVGEESVRYIQGYFPETTGQLPDGLSYCLVHIDCDLYAPARSALEYFYPRMVPGGFIVIHDYSSLAWNGAERAVDDFFADKVESIVPLPDSAGSAVVRKATEPGRNGNWRIRKSRMIFDGEWKSAANDGLSEILGAGWSVSEDWGVWAVGSVHEFMLWPAAGMRSLAIDFDVHAPLAEHLKAQRVSVLVQGKEITEWQFSAEINRSVRTLHVQLPDPAGHEVWPLKIELRSVFHVIPRDVDASSSDARDLGIALHRLRIRPGNAAE